MPTIDIRYALAGLALALSASVAPAAPPLVAEWTQKAPISPFISDTNPGPRAWTNLTYDPVNARMALFGGSAGSRFVADVWHYDTLTDSWTAIDRPADDCPGTFGFSGPDGRDTQSVVYDAYNHLYWSISGGGHKCTGTRAVQRTAGAGSNTTTVVDPALPGDVPVDYFKDWSVYTASTVVYVTGYDPATRTLRLASPISGFGPGSAYWIKVWTVGGSWFFSPVTHEWQRLEGPHWGFTGPTPEPIYGGNTRAVVYTPVDRGLVLFGGAVNGNTRNDTWFLDSVTKTWVQKQPNSSVSGPTKRSEISGGMVYDSVNDVFILFGGRCDGADPRCPGGKNVLNDTWAYKLSTNTWTQMSPPVSPAARVGHQMSFDAEHGVVVMFGGTTVRDMYATSPTVATTPRDLWIYDYATNTWTDITPSVSPPGRYIGSMTYDPVAHVSVLFGGNEPGITPSGRIWTLKLTDPSNINQLPTAAATVTPGSGTTTTDFVFDGSGSSDPDGSIASYAWSFGDGSTATGMTATHRYNSGGNYTVTLTVTDNRGSTAQRSITVSVVGNDTIPDAFSFAAVSNAPVNTLVASGPVAVSGINVPSPISVSGGEYSVDGGAYTTAAGTVSNGQSVRVRLLSSASYSTLRTATLTIGGVSASFSVTTTGNDTDPNAFSFTAVNNVALSTTVTSATATIGGINAPAPISITGGMYSINNGPFTSDPGTIQNGQGVRVQLVSSANFATTTSAVLTVGSVSGSFNVTTAAEDTVPDAFSFAPVTNAALSTAYVSAGFTVWGINAPTSISITGGEYSVAGGAYTSAPGTVVKGQGVRVRVMSSPNMNTQTSATLTVGTVSAAFNVTTSGLDTTPNPFSFASVTGAAPSTLIASAAITVGGINSATPISVSGGEYSIDGGAYTSAAGSVNNGQTVRLRVLSSAGYLAQTSATVTIGGVSGTFNVTTAAMDTTPNAFSFNPVTTALPNALVTSGSATISGINAATPISVSGGEYSISGGAFTSASGNISSGQTVRVRLTASPAYSSQTSATLSIGGVSATFYVTTVAEDSTPNAFTFRDSTGQALSTLITSTTTTISGINADTSITISGGEYSVNNGPFTSAPGTIQNGKGVRVRLLSSANYSTTTSATVTIGGVSGTFNVTTAAADSTPDAFSFTAVTNAALNTLVISNGITVWGTNAPSDISVTNGEYSVSGGAYTSAPGTVVKGQTVRIRIRTSSDPATTTGGTLTIGGVSATFNATTAP